ncbi:MAG: ROK family transcriptional regulator [Nocardioidaceae bacterium]
MRPGTPRLLRGINDRAALDLLLEHGRLSRTRLGELTSLSKPTASQLLARLERAGLVVATGVSEGGPGRGAQLYEINPASAYVAALDVTPTRILGTVADITGRVIGQSAIRTRRGAGVTAVQQVLDALEAALCEPGLDSTHLHRVVIGTPGAFDPTTGRLRYARHLPGWHAPDLLVRLAEAVGVPVEVENDVNLAAVAERETGRAVGVDDFVLLWADEGLGAAIVIDGRLHAGATGGAGEVGFLPLPGTPLVRNVGRSNAGGFQELAGGRQVLALARSLGLRAGSPQAAVAHALVTPGPGDRLLQQLGERLALGLASMVAVLDPALVVLAGGVLRAGGERLADVVRAELADLSVPRPGVEISAVPGDPVLTGALHTALAATREHVFDTLQSPTTLSVTT